MDNYYNYELDKYDCDKAYNYFINKLGSKSIDRMTEEEYRIFKVLSYLKRHYDYLTRKDLIEEKNNYCIKNLNLSLEEAENINLFKL